MYDFILFENYHLAVNHLKDVVIIARLLKKCGYSVAIAKIYPDQNYELCEGIDYIELDISASLPRDEYSLFPKSKIHSFLSMLRFLYQQHFYMKEVLSQIVGKAKNYYYGSYHLLMPIVLLKDTNQACNYFTWGLRSSRLSAVKEAIFPNPILALRMIILRSYYLKKNNLKFFVSDNFIKKEFLTLGISEKQLIIRPERMLHEIPGDNYDKLTNKFSLLTIGSLRQDKRIEVSVQEIKELSGDWEYVIAGKANDKKYSQLIEKQINSDPRIKRIDKRLDEFEYNLLIQNAHFVLLNDCQQISAVTNGTLMEALMNFRPIIAPNYLPYSYYIDNFNIGFSFDPSIEGSLKQTIEKARNIGCIYFEDNIRNFLRLITTESILGQFSLDLKKCNSCN